MNLFAARLKRDHQVDGLSRRRLQSEYSLLLDSRGRLRRRRVCQGLVRRQIAFSCGDRPVRGVDRARRIQRGVNASWRGMVAVSTRLGPSRLF